jgi:nucleoside-diphosphate-sugar epimerase
MRISASPATTETTRVVGRCGGSCDSSSSRIAPAGRRLTLTADILRAAGMKPASCDASIADVGGVVRLFVTGASGFIGSHFVEQALAAGHEVVALCRPDGNAARRSELAALGVTVVNGNVLDPTTLDGTLGRIDCVCHFAAAFKEGGATEDYFRRVNVDGTANLITLAHKHGARRFVLCSTAGIYGQRVAGLIDESRPTSPWNAYERSKVAAEDAIRRHARELGMEYVIIRPTAVYGPRDERLLKLFRSAARGRFPLFGRGDGRRHMVYVSDLADAFLRACTVPAAANQEMIVAGPEAVPLRELLQTLATLSNRRSAGPRLPLKPMLVLAAVTEDVCGLLKINPPLYRRRMDFYTNDAAFDSSRARKVLDWEPKVSLREGLARTIRANQVSLQRGALAGVVSIVGVVLGLPGFIS